MTDAAIGYGIKYDIWDASLTTPAFVEVGEVFNLTPGEATAGRVDATHYQSPGRRREYISELIDSGEGSFEINWVPGNGTDVRLRELFESGATVQHRITFPNGVTVAYDASILGFSKAVPLDDRMTATVTIGVSGIETWGEAA